MPLTLEEIEKRVILHRLKVLEWNKTRTARSLGICIRTLRNKIVQYREEGFFDETREVFFRPVLLRDFLETRKPAPPIEPPKVEETPATHKCVSSPRVPNYCQLCGKNMKGKV